MSSHKHVQPDVLSSNTSTITGVINKKDFEALRADFRGGLIRPGDEEYDAARRVHNGRINRNPGLIAQCAGVADVIKAVNFAREHNLPASIRGGGHSVVGFAVCDDGVVIDLSPMKGMFIDPAVQTIRVEAGLTWGEINHDLQLFNLGATGGYVSSTGVPGVTLGGGFGWLVRPYGLACDNLLSADVVTANGRFIRASSTENPDLFWGLRGGGGNFGIATSFEFRVYPVGQALGGLLFYPIEKAKEVLQFYRDFMETAPELLTTGVVFFTAPSFQFLPSEVHGKPIFAILVMYPGDVRSGEQCVRKLREFGPPIADGVAPMPYSAVQTSADALFPRGLLNYWKSNFSKSLEDGAIQIIADYMAHVPSPLTVVVIDYFGNGAVKRIKETDTAFPHRNLAYDVGIVSQWSSPADTDKNIGWAREFSQAMQPFLADAAYVNYLDNEGSKGVRQAYGPNYARLAELKKKYDPTNFFRFNQNIEPAP